MEFTAAAATEGPPPPVPMPPLLRLSADATIYLVQFLPLEDLMSLSGACVQLKDICRADPVWTARLRLDLGIDDHVKDLPPLLSATPASAFTAYLSWRQEFQGYTLSLVRRVKMWWRRMEQWLLADFREILVTLRDPLTEAQIISLTKDKLYPNFAIPPVLRLMYRFHNGQHIPGQDRLLHDTTHEAQLASRAEFLATGYGLFGGVSFYESFTNCYLLPLEDLVVLNCATSHYRDDTTDYACRVSSLFLGEASGVRELPGRGRAADYTLFAVNALGTSAHPTPEKGFFVGRVAAKDNNSVYTNSKGCVPIDDDLILTPCMSNGECEAARADCEPAMLRWLYEYLRRLEQGVYRVEPREMPLTSLDQQLRVYENRGAAHYQISLFKHGPASQACVTNGVELTGHPYLVTHMSVAGDRALHDIADPNYTPAQGAYAQAQQTLFWTYSIRMRLLEDHPSRPPLLSAVQLVSRHWVIKEADQPASVVNGPGVIGHTPMLLADRRLPFAFSYQSCTEGRKPQVFDGTIKFRCAPGSLRRDALPGPPPVLRDTKGREVPGEDSFFADLPRIVLDPLQDSYIY